MGGWACRRVGKARVYALEGGGGREGETRDRCALFKALVTTVFTRGHLRIRPTHFLLPLPGRACRRLAEDLLDQASAVRGTVMQAAMEQELDKHELVTQIDDMAAEAAMRLPLLQQALGAAAANMSTRPDLGPWWVWGGGRGREVE